MNRWPNGWWVIPISAVALFSYGISPLAAQCQSSASFGYPSPYHAGSQRQNWQQSRHEIRQQSEKVFRRNQAWPKPFDCWDRQSYFAIWYQCYDAGNCADMTLLDSHFEPQSDQLNAFGERRLALILSNPSNHLQTVFVSRTNDDRLNQMRVASVRAAVDRMFGGSMGTQVAISDQTIVPLNGRYHSTVNELRLQQTPPPVISVGSQSSVAGSVDGN